MTNFEKPRLIADMLRSARGKFREILSPRAKGGTSAGDANEGQQATLEAELETYKHAFESTAADRDRLAEEVERYRHAFETTATDRDIHKKDAIDWKCAVTAFLNNDEFKGALASRRRDSLPQPRKRGLPNVFCVGVQKSATSFLYSVLRLHPKVAVYPKDIGVLPQLHETGLMANYDKMVADIDETRPVIAQFEVGYISYAESGIETIRERLCENPRIIVCVRNPVERMLSEYKMHVRTIGGKGTFVENYDFEDALEMERDRSVNDPRFAYKERSRYSENIGAYIKAFGRENVHVVVIEADLSQDAHSAIGNLFDFLSLFDSDGFKLSLLSHHKYRQNSRAPSEIEVVFQLVDGSQLYNPAGMEEVAERDVVRLEVRSNVPTQLNISHDDPLPELLASAIHLKERLAYEPSQEEKLRLFNTYFRDDVAQLEYLLGRDLSVWYAG